MISVRYQSGRSFRITGSFKGVLSLPNSAEVAVTFLITGPCFGVGGEIPVGEMLIVDPRCFCVDDETGTVIYNPMQHMHRLPRWAKKEIWANKAWRKILQGL